MDTYLCPQGHASIDADYCSDCGAKINVGVASAGWAAVRAPQATQACPDCSTLHELVSGKFCEICGYNFSSGAHGELPIAEVEPGITQPVAHLAADGATAIPVSALPPAAAEMTVSSTTQWEVIMTIDPALRYADSPPPPVQLPFAIKLNQTSTLIGRTSQIRAIHPDIALDLDDAVSHRHALINQQSPGQLTLRDIGSSNGTAINGIEIATMVDIVINHGDEITLGHWTKLTINQIN